MTSTTCEMPLTARMAAAGITIDGDGMYVVPGYGRLLPLPAPLDNEEHILPYIGRRRSQRLPRPPCERVQARRPATWALYVIGPADGDRIKIGISFDVPKRLAALQSGSPVELRVIGSWVCGNAKQVEKRMHKRLAAARLHGEWFDARHPDVEAWLASAHGPLEWLERHGH